MNKVRRKMLKDSLIDIDKIINNIESVKDGEEESLDALPDGLLNSSRATEMEENIDALEEIYNLLEEVSSTMEEIITR